MVDKISNFIATPYVLFSVGFFLIFPYHFLNLFHLGKTTSIFIYYFPFFIFGAIFFPNKVILSSIKSYSNVALFLACLISLNFFVYSAFENNPQEYFLNYGKIASIPHLLLKALNQWLWVIGIFGSGMRFLNKSSGVLNYATKAVYPFYIFHQTVILGIAYYVVELQAPIILKLALIIVLTFFSILLVYEYLLKRTYITRLLFGIKVNISKREASLPIIVSEEQNIVPFSNAPHNIVNKYTNHATVDNASQV